jgi:hypothetical protein
MPNIAKRFLSFVPVLLLSGCMILNPNKRTELTEMSYPGEVHISKPLVIDLSKATAQIPVEEAVWTNIGGPYHIPEESRTIGFSQNYRFEPFPGGATVVNTGSVLVVPFGRIFAETLYAAMAKAPLGTVCATPACMNEVGRKYPEYTVMAVDINDFRTWETPFNRINFSSKVNVNCRPGNDGVMVARSVTEAEKDVSIGHMFQTGYGLTANMRDIAKQFGVKVVERVLGESAACFRDTAAQR